MAKQKLLLSYVTSEKEEKLAFKSYVGIQNKGNYNMATEIRAYGPAFIKNANLNARLIRRSIVEGKDIEELAIDWVIELISKYSELKEKYNGGLHS